MAATYETPDSDTMKYLHDARELYHGDRLDGIRIGMLLAHAPVDEETGEAKGVAIKHHGVPALALARIGKVPGKRLRARVETLAAEQPSPLRHATIVALLAAEAARASAKPRTSLLGALELILGDAGYSAGDELEADAADQWAALLLCYATAPKLEHVEAGIPSVQDIAVVRHVLGVEAGRGKASRATVVELCEERLAELLEGGQR